MNTEELNKLLKKYYNGQSTLEEERSLKIFFDGDNIPEGYEAEKEIFRYYASAINVPEPSDDLESSIMARIDESENGFRSGRKIRYILPYISVAAGILILAGSYFFFIHRNENNRDTFTDPQIAYNETIKILMNVSSRLNQGTSVLEPVSKMNQLTVKSFKAINKSAKVVEKRLRSLGYLEKAIDITYMPVEKSIIK